MAKTGDIIETHIKRWDAGMENDYFDKGLGRCKVSKHFDILTLTDRLVPTRSTTTDTSGTGIGNLLIGSDGNLYGLGADASNPTTNSQLYQKTSIAGAWTALGNEKTGSSALNFDLFIEYPSNGAREIICGGSANNIAMLDKENVASVANQALTYNSLSQGLVHPKDDVLYVPYTDSSGNTYIASNNAGSWTAAALTLPKQLIVTSLAAYGNYLAIACAPKSAFTLATTGKTLDISAAGGSYRSVVFLWDRNSSFATLTESIDWGTGILMLLNTMDNKLYGISDMGGASVNIIDRDSILVKEYAGGTPVTIKEITTKRDSTGAANAKINPYVNFVYRDRLYFSVDIVGGSSNPAYYGLWSIGRSKVDGQWSVCIERTPNDAGASQSVLAAAILGDYASMVYNANGTMGISVTGTTESSAFASTSYLETLVYNAGDSSLKKKLIGVTLTFEPLRAGGQVVLKYKKDNETSFTTIFTDSTAGDVSHSSMNIESSGATLPEYNEISFRIESTGGATITGLSFREQITGKRPY